MQRREFLKLSTAALAASAVNTSVIAGQASADNHSGDAPAFYVSSGGNDRNAGTAAAPFATLQRAQRAIRQLGKRSGPIQVVVREGTYYLNSSLVLGPEDSGSKEAPIIYRAPTDERVTLSGGRKLSCEWSPYKNGISMTAVPAGSDFTQLFVNGKRQIRARYPNYDPSVPGKSGYINAAGPIPADASSPYAQVDEDMTFSTQ